MGRSLHLIGLLGFFIIRGLRMIGIIKQIGEALGWHPMPYANGAAVQFGGGKGPEIVWLSDPIRFAAHAKAEMAKRGWTPFAEGTTVGYSIQFFDEYGEQANGNGQTTSCHDYDPRDPIAEANATLLAIAEALTVTPNASHQTAGGSGPASREKQKA